MKINTKKTISAVLALILSAAVLTTGCGRADDIADTAAQTEVSYSEAAVTEETFLDLEVTKAEFDAKSNKWNETQINDIMYTTMDCYSRVSPVAGSDKVKKYVKGAKVNVIAATDTGYFKLKDGSFIHSSFLSDTKPGEVTTAPDDDIEEIFDDEDTTSATKKTTAKTTKKTTSKTTSKTTAKTTKKTTSKTTAKTTKKTTDETVKNNTSTTVSYKYNVDYKTKYVYKQLPAAEQKLYANIVEAAKSFKSKVPVPDGLTDTQVIKTYTNVIYQEPQLFWLPSKVPSCYAGYLDIKYIYTSAEVAEIQPGLDKNVKTVMNTVNQYKSTFSKIKVIYDWVVKTSEFSESDSEDTSSVKNGLTKDAGLQCAGYARTMQYLFDVAGIESVVIIGKNAEGTTHAWNKVYCENGYYNIDATWGDPINDHDKNYIRYNYFLVPDAWIKNDHLNPNTFFRSNGSTIHLFEEPACTKTSANYYKATNKEFSSYKDAVAGMKAEIDAAIKAGSVAVTVRVTDKSIWDKMNTNDTFRELQNYAKAKSSKVKKISRLTKYGEGCYVVQYDIYYK
ncbi:MAG: transglutaminase domain-containing protein [Oscillospiraceae bacterium]